jgi:SpoIIAA-like
MTIELTRLPDAGDETPSESRVGIQVIGKLAPRDLELLQSQLDLQIEQHRRIRLLIELVDFEGWTPAALWKDVRISLEHYRDIDRVAVIGDNRWERALAELG